MKPHGVRPENRPKGPTPCRATLHKPQHLRHGSTLCHKGQTNKVNQIEKVMNQCHVRDELPDKEQGDDKDINLEQYFIYADLHLVH